LSAWRCVVPTGAAPPDSIWAGLTYPLVAPGYKPDAAAGVITDGLTPKDVKKPYLRSFPYLGVPYGGYYNPS